MPLDSLETVRELAEGVTLYFMPGYGYGFFVMKICESAPTSRYLSREGTWEGNCIRGWFPTAESAVEVYESTVPKAAAPASIPDDPQLEEDRHWENRQV